MSLKDLLPEGTFDEIAKEAHFENQESSKAGSDGQILVKCPHCHKEIVYSTSNPFRPFCSEQCKILDLGDWADNKHVVKGKSIIEDDDADLVNSSHIDRLDN